MLSLKAGKELMLVNGRSDLSSFTQPLDVIDLVGVGVPSIPLGERETFSGTGAVVFGKMIDHLGTLSPEIINTFFMLEDFIREGSKKSTGKLESD